MRIHNLVGLVMLGISSTALAKPIILHGQTADVAIETGGFAQTLGPGSLGGQYERLVQAQLAEAGKPALNMSVLVDTPPPSFAAKDLPAHVLSSYQKRYGANKPTITVLGTPNGFWFDFDEPSVAGHTWNLYFETMAQGRWLEIHFSAVNTKPDEVAALRQHALTFLKNVTFTPKPSVPAAK